MYWMLIFDAHEMDPVLLWLNSVAFWLINYVGVVLNYDLTYRSYFFCWFTALIFYDAKRGNKLGVFR